MIKIRAEINETGRKKLKINETKSWFLEKMRKIEIFSAKLTIQKRKKNKT